ncbi:MAG TPA: DNA-directed RNA polymerase subunit A' [Thermoplasmata archaeon]|nr:DNA-directed RNA polymerase subunit A' [Thermoplasmata archaeon]
MIPNQAPRKIGWMEFGLLSPEELRKLAVTKIISADTYDEDGFPIEMGLMDPRLGTIDPGLRCKTCGQKVDACPGHFGYIDLAMPVIHVGFAKTIKNCLANTCKECGRLLLTDGEREELLQKMKSGLEGSRLPKQVALKASKAANCPHCGIKTSMIDSDKPTTFRANGRKLIASEIREWLEKIKDEDLPFLDINPKTARPEWMVLTVLLVPPISTRPSITLQSGERSEDDLTHKLVDIIHINQKLQENRDAGAPQLIIEDLWELLQYHITTYFDNQTSGIPPARHRSGRALKTLSQRLKGKEGRFRSNLSGKRVNFSARTVISPDSHISVNEVVVPIEIARELTLPVRIIPNNLEAMRELVKRGPNPQVPNEYYVPGVNYVIRKDGRKLKVIEKDAEELADRLEMGYVVERQLMDGDIVLFNRQPSLHRMSMMAHMVKVMPNKTFRLNLSVCPPYNADFDGDEMNLHAVQSEEARSEAEVLMKVQENMLSPRFGGPIIGALHDHITGCFLLTYKQRKFSMSEVTQILSAIDYKGKLPKVKVDKQCGKWISGKDIFSLLLPKELNLEYRATCCAKCEVCQKRDCPNDAWVVLRDGRLLQGTIDDKSIGAFKGEILAQTARRWGNKAACQFLDKITRMGIATLDVLGFSLGIDDEDIPSDAKNQIKETLDKTRKKIENLIKAYEDGNLEVLPARSPEETLEMEIMRATGQGRDLAGEIASRSLGMDNNAVIMAKSGARGSMLNVSQMAGCVGQQAVRGERISRGYLNRTLPHFKPGDLSAEAKGFVSSSYKSGLTPTEYFFNSMGGREGLVDTAVRTSRSGYMQRRLINALEDIKVKEDGSVRDTTGSIIQFQYGEDGVDPSKSVFGDAVKIDDIIKEAMEGE